MVVDLNLDKLKIHNEKYSVQSILLYIILNKVDSRIKIKVRPLSRELKMNIHTILNAVKVLKELGVIHRVGWQDYIINEKYIR